MRTPDDYQQLIADKCREHGTKLGRSIDYIETGVCTGNSAEAVLATGYVRFAMLIDTFPGEYCGHIVSVENVQNRLQQFNGSFQIRKGNSRHVLPEITKSFDVGFVDGDHSEEGCKADMQLMLPVLREDAIMFVDDLDGSGLKRCVEQFAADNNLTMIYHKVHEGLGELRRK